MMRLLMSVALTFLAATEVLADDPPKEQKPEALPAPKQAAPEVVYVIPERPQPGTREIWQYYGLDNRGRFLPRVIYTPNVSFYLRNGEIYPWTWNRPTLYMPYSVD